MAVQASRLYETVTMPGASNTTQFLRVPAGLDDTDYADLPLELLVAVEDTGVGHVDRD